MTRRKYSADFKMQIVRECLETGNVAIVARKHELHANVVARWVRQYKENGEVKASRGKPNQMTQEEQHQVMQENVQLASENEQLKKLLGEKDLEIAILRDLVKKKNPHLLTGLK
jgi:transposase